MGAEDPMVVVSFEIPDEWARKIGTFSRVEIVRGGVSAGTAAVVSVGDRREDPRAAVRRVTLRCRYSVGQVVEGWNADPNTEAIEFVNVGRTRKVRSPRR